jgi:hypothetical protein
MSKSYLRKHVPPFIQYFISFEQVSTMPSTMRSNSTKIGLFLWHLHFVNLLWAVVFLKTIPLTENSRSLLLFGRFFCKLIFLTVTSMIPLLIAHKPNSLIIKLFDVFKSLFFLEYAEIFLDISICTPLLCFYYRVNAALKSVIFPAICHFLSLRSKYSPFHHFCNALGHIYIYGNLQNNNSLSRILVVC